MLGNKSQQRARQQKKKNLLGVDRECSGCRGNTARAQSSQVRDTGKRGSARENNNANRKENLPGRVLAGDVQ
jgi:hypothetical protein